jgi:hypothetical protein
MAEQSRGDRTNEQGSSQREGGQGASAAAKYRSANARSKVKLERRYQGTTMQPDVSSKRIHSRKYRTRSNPPAVLFGPDPPNRGAVNHRIASARSERWAIGPAPTDQVSPIAWRSPATILNYISK